MGGNCPLSATSPQTPFLALFRRPPGLRDGDSLACLAPSQQDLTRALPRLPAERKALADVLPPGAVQEAARNRVEGRAWWLILDSSISQELQDAPWESLTLGGEALAANALVVRDASWAEADPREPSGLRRGGSGFLNLFPAQEHDFAARLEAHVASERVIHCYPRFAREGLDRFDELIVVAHGGPFEGPKEVQHCYDRTDVDGFLAASSVERLPVEPVLADVVQSYKNLRLKR